MIKKIYTILVLIANVLIRKHNYTLPFKAIRNGNTKRWYYDFKHWGFSQDNLEMVCGADALCELYAEGKDEVTVKIKASRYPYDNINLNEYDEFVREDVDKSLTTWEKLIMGRVYKNITVTKEGKTKLRTMWICPVTIFVLGRYPKFIYIKNQNGRSN